MMIIFFYYQVATGGHEVSKNHLPSYPLVFGFDPSENDRASRTRAV
jgi:hypothetical protein